MNSANFSFHRADIFEVLRIVVLGRLPLIEEIVGIHGKRSIQALFDDCIRCIACRRELLECLATTIRRKTIEHGGELRNSRLLCIVSALPRRISTNALTDELSHHPVST